MLFMYYEETTEKDLRLQHNELKHVLGIPERNH